MGFAGSSFRHVGLIVKNYTWQFYSGMIMALCIIHFQSLPKSIHYINTYFEIRNFIIVSNSHAILKKPNKTPNNNNKTKPNQNTQPKPPPFNSTGRIQRHVMLFLQSEEVTKTREICLFPLRRIYF